MANFYRGRAWIELSRGALENNVERLRALLPEGCALMPAVKANAYGHGAALVAGALNGLGVDAFCTASVSEGVELRRRGVRGEILILGYTHPRYAPLLVRYRLTQTVADRRHALELNARGRTVDVHVKVDTGMHRLGERWDDAGALREIRACRNLRITGVYTHLYQDDLTRPADREAALRQGEALRWAADCLRSMGCPALKTHILASGGLLHCPELGGDYARVGLALYGQTGPGVMLRPVLSLKARITLIRDIPPGEGAGYGHRFVAERRTRLAVAAIGYGDGLPRGLSGGVGAALVRGCRAPIAGRICMDQTLLDVTDVPGAAPGDTAVLIGSSGDREITAGDIAEQTGTIPNEILSRLGGRLERRLVQ